VLDKITQQTFRASEIVNSLLNFSRTASNDFTSLDLNQVLSETAALVEPQLRKAGIELDARLFEDLPNVRGVPGKLQQVFLNPLINARDAMPGGGRLTVISEVAEDSSGESVARVIVRDTGVGIAREQLARVFDPFFTTKGPRRGTGLGLSVSYGIIKEHGGGIDVDSVPGEGAVFTIELPLASKPIHA
jgi:hypothetical protein